MIAFLGPNWQWLIILVIVLLLFGNRIPGMARALGSGITEFKKGLREGNQAGDDKQLGNNKSEPTNKPPA